jgi:hypothetical protein
MIRGGRARSQQLGLLLALLAALVLLPGRPALAGTGSGTFTGSSGAAYSYSWAASGAGNALVSVNWTASDGVSVQCTNQPACGNTGQNLVASWRCASTGAWTQYGSTGPAWQTEPQFGGPKKFGHQGYCDAAGATAVRLGNGFDNDLRSTPHEVVFAPATRAASSCTLGTFGPVTATNEGGNVNVRLTWTGTPPAGGWKVYSPDYGAGTRPASPTATVPRQVLDGTNRTYGVTFAAVAGATSVVVESAAQPTCYASSAITGDAPPADDVSDGEVSCGITLNVFCYLKAGLRWAFYCDEECFAGWESRAAALGDQPPLDFLGAGLTIVRTIAVDLDCQLDFTASCTPGAHGALPVRTALRGPGTEAGTGVDLLDVAGDVTQETVWGRVVYELVAWGLLGGWAVATWHRVRQSFGGQS